MDPLTLRRSFPGTSRFEVLEELGAGGMGVVYRAFDRELGVHVALKTLRALTPDSLLRFKTEFRDFHTLLHPNLVSLGELYSEKGEWFFTMELVPGKSFLAHVRPGSVETSPHSSTFASDTLPGATAVPARPPNATEAAGVLDEARLRSALRQLASALCSLHAAGKVHRDVKSSNVLVSDAGRVVLLDFGLAIDRRERSGEQLIVGTCEYMAPEQAKGGAVGPAADWYAVGVMLYQALTGRVPIGGTPIEIVTSKQHLLPTSPRDLGLEVPADLEELCMALLAIAPGARPEAAEVLRRLGAESPAPATKTTDGVTFVGRARELAALHAAFASAAKEATTVVVSGESGLGKSTLVRQFAEDVVARQPGTVVLTGSCYERETVPYKAIDGVLDALSLHLSRLSPVQVSALLPRRAALLAQAFPVMARVPAVAHAPFVGRPGQDPQELRSQLFAALRELLARLADRQPLVVVIDDLQWADADSLASLGEIMRPPEAPSLLLVATARAEPGPAAEWASALRGKVETLALARLSPEEARELAESLIQDGGSAGGVSADQIAREAAGHPLFIDELVRHAGAGAPGSLQLEDALRARIARLDERTQEVLALVATASARLAQGTGAHAAHLPFGEFARQIAVLRAAQLVRTTGLGAGDWVEPYHDRVRQAVVRAQSPERHRAHHLRLAAALEAAGATDLEALTVHWREAGDLARTADFASAAADKADKALAFDRAARFYQLALDALAPADPRRQALRVRHADALANAGRGEQAGDAYLEAARSAAPADALDLRRRAAEQLLRSGHLDRGAETLREVVATVGMHVAATPRRALVALLARRAQVRLRGLRFHERDAREVPVDTLTRIDTCWAAAVGFANVDTIRAAHFQTQHLLLALAAGEPYRVARALAMEGGFASIIGLRGRRRADRLLAESNQLAARLGHAHAQGLATLLSGVAAFQVGEWRRARHELEHADALLRERCTGVSWELALGNMFHLSSLYYLGELALLAQKLPRLLEEGSARGDLFAKNNLRMSNFTVAWLLADDVERARRDPEAALRGWKLPAASAQDYYALVSLTNAELYAGDGEAAWQRVQATWPAVEASMFLRVQYVRGEALHLRARAALAAAAQGHDRERALAQAAHDARRLRREGAIWTEALALLVEAGLAEQRGEKARVGPLLAEAAEACLRADLGLYAAAARFRNEAGGRGETYWEKQGAKRPERLVAMLTPGIPV